MKTITIGRGEGCDIQIDHNKISRRHAILKIYTFGKMEIVDMGQNGTWVNGVKLRSGVPFPVKRKDVVNFAEVSQLNWSLVPNPTKYLELAVFYAIILILFIFVVVICVSKCFNDSYEPYKDNQNPVTTEQTMEGVISNDTISKIQQPPISSNDKNEIKEKKEENAERKNIILHDKKSDVKTAEQLFPFINKKNDSTKKEKEKKTDINPKSKGKKSEKNQKKVQVII